MDNYNWHKTVFITVGLALLFISILLHFRGKEKVSFLLLVLASFFVCLFSVFLFDYLNLWDERFHALVAKNIMDNPLKPTLYKDPIVPIKYNWWDCAHIWLHKQPLFLWQIALSFKIFGVNVFALRLPSAILSTGLVAASYRTAKLLCNTSVAFYSGILVLSSQYLMLLVSGYAQTDHNDLVFLCYISFSIWAFVEYTKSNKKRWIIAIGIFCGAAILTKWLVGLLIYFIWAIYSLQTNKLVLKKYWDIALAFIVTIVMVAPWQIFIAYAYPEVSRIEQKYNFHHLITPLEGHGGPFTYHFKYIDTFYGIAASFILIPSLFFLWYKAKNKQMVIALLISILFVYLFFSFTATKMPSFTIVVAMPIFIAIACLLDVIIEQIKKWIQIQWLNKLIIGIGLFVMVTWRINLPDFYKNHGFWNKLNECDEIAYNNATIFKNLHLPQKYVLFNIKGHQYVEAMFFSNNTAYNFVPSEKQYIDLKNSNKEIAIFVTQNDTIPDYLKQDKNLVIISKETRACD